MSPFMQNVSVWLWAAIAVIFAVLGIQQKKAYVFGISAFFVFLTVWYGINAYGGIDMFSGALGIIFRSILIGILVILIGVYIFLRIKKRNK